MDIKIGYRILGTLNIALTVDLEKNPHWLICGDSGSGKSYLLRYIFYSLKQIRKPDCLYIADFKNSGDYDGFVPEENYAAGPDCVELVNRYYERYQEIKENNLSDKILLVFDEWAGFCIWSEGYDKKISKQAKDQMSEILMMGRKLGSNGGSAGVFTVLQRPDSVYFANSRNQYFIQIVMRDVNKSIRTMLEIDQEDIPTEHKAIPGHGILLESGKDPIAFIVPTYDEQGLTDLLKAKQSEA